MDQVDLARRTHRATDSQQQQETDVEPSMSPLADVAACTMAATHRRDHEHSRDPDTCHPHVVEVVHLGSRAVCVCHDCRLDSGFLPRREAEVMAAGHRDLTRETNVRLCGA